MKAILVIDTDNCWDCPLERDAKCQYSHKKIPKKNIPSWCPLKPMPQKKEEACAEKYAESTYVVSYTGAHEISAKTHPLYADGWNACIKEIEK